jgi:LysR family transcriptional regulator for bpeEF and oprC
VQAFLEWVHELFERTNLPACRMLSCAKSPDGTQASPGISRRKAAPSVVQ